MAKKPVGSSVVSNDEPEKFASSIADATKIGYDKGWSIQMMTHQVVANPGVHQWSTKYFQSAIIIWEEAQ